MRRSTRSSTSTPSRPRPPRAFSTTPPPLAYDCYASHAERWWAASIAAEAQKFADYEVRLRDWEESEKRRARAVVEAARAAAEAEAQRAHQHMLNERRRAHQAMLAQQRAAAAAAAGAAGKGKRVRGGGEDDDSEDDDMTLATLQNKGAGGSGGKKRKGGDVDAALGGRKKSHKKQKSGRGGVARPWSPTEDQLLCAIVHEFGSNWGLITDVFAASAPFKGVFRRAEQCRYRFQTLTQSAESDDPNAVRALDLDKTTARQVMQRALPVEDNTARTHFERAGLCAVKHAKLRRAAAAERAGDDYTRRAVAHASWGAHRGLRTSDPCDLADQARSIHWSPYDGVRVVNADP